MRSLWFDARYGLRLLKREPGFAAVAILTIALGVGATTTLFSVANGVLLKPLPWADSDRLVRISETRQGRSGRVRGTILNGTYLAWADHPATLDAIGGWLGGSATTMTASGEPERLQVMPVTPSLFPMLQVRPLVGRLFAADDGARGGPGMVILSYGLWQSRFGGRRDIVGQTVRLDDRPFTIVGVMPRDFAFPNREVRAWTAWAVQPLLGEGGVISGTIFSAMARLKPGISLAQAAAEGTTRGRAAPNAGMVATALFGSSGPVDVSAVPAREALTAEVKPAIVIMLVAVLLLLATATANIASLQLARATTRRRELAIRAAIGAAAGRLTRQLLAESSLLGAAGGAAGLGLAIACHRVLPSILPSDFPRLDDVAIDRRVVLCAMALSIVTSVVCGLLPALQARRVNLVETLAESGGAPGGGFRSRAGRVRSSIMVGQVAVACVMLVAAALLVRSFVALMHADRGYDPVNLLTTQIPLPPTYPVEQRLSLVETLVARLQALPGVMHAAAGNALPFVSMGGFMAFTMPSGRSPGSPVEVQAIQRIVTPGYFTALRLRVLSGRPLGVTDNATARPAVVVNRSFADAYLGDRRVGARIPAPRGGAGFRFRDRSSDWEIVGVVDDMRQDRVDAPPQPEIFATFAQALPTTIRSFNPVLVVRTVSDPVAFAPALRRVVREAAPGVAPDAIMTMEDRVMTSLARPRTYAVLLAAFAGFALAIAAVGLFGVLSYSVAQRAREIGVRTALGAQTRDIVALVMRQAVVVAGTGLAAGLALAAAAARLLSGLLYGVSAYDPASFTAVPLLLAAVTLTACIVPALRAARVDPLTVLREN